jgi:hypothetical protein
MIDSSFLINMMNTSLNSITESVKKSVVSVEDEITALPSKENIGVTISKEDYNKKVSSIKNNVSLIDTSLSGIQQVSEAINTLGTTFQTINIIVTTIMTATKLSVAAVPGAGAIMAAQEIMDFAKNLKQQLGSGASSLTAQAKGAQEIVVNTQKSINDLNNKVNYA